MKNLSEAYELQLEENTYDTSFLPIEQDFFSILFYSCVMYIHYFLLSTQINTMLFLYMIFNTKLNTI